MKGSRGVAASTEARVRAVAHEGEGEVEVNYYQGTRWSYCTHAPRDTGMNGGGCLQTEDHGLQLCHTYADQREIVRKQGRRPFKESAHLRTRFGKTAPRQQGL
eukprot:GHVU01053203.1.p1 GENE.GHVU01053203.1~~GHVU01053203.1.p1  ORF type:complete len:103 (-),score=5.32 GHVU01053203.1:331-639(-)